MADFTLTERPKLTLPYHNIRAQMLIIYRLIGRSEKDPNFLLWYSCQKIRNLNLNIKETPNEGNSIKYLACTLEKCQGYKRQRSIEKLFQITETKETS